jgi:hypothetical protein
MNISLKQRAIALLHKHKRQGGALTPFEREALEQIKRNKLLIKRLKLEEWFFGLFAACSGLFVAYLLLKDIIHYIF